MFPFGLALGCFGDDGSEGFCQARAQLLVFGDLQPRVERLVCQPPVPVVGVQVGVVRVSQEPQEVVEERPTADVLLVVLDEALLDVGQSGANTVLVPLERREVDGVGEVRGEQLVALGFKLRPVCHEVGYLLVAACRASSCRRLARGAKLAELRATGRPRLYCSPTCRKAAYEDRRAHRDGAVKVQIVEKMVTEVRERRIEVPHPRSDCVKAVRTDEDEMFAVIWTLTALVRDRTRKAYDPDQARFNNLAHHVAALHEALLERGQTDRLWTLHEEPADERAVLDRDD